MHPRTLLNIGRVSKKRGKCCRVCMLYLYMHMRKHVHEAVLRMRARRSSGGISPRERAYAAGAPFLTRQKGWKKR